MRAALYFHTLRHLRPMQFWRRAVFALRKPQPGADPPPALRRANGAWIAPPPRRPSRIDARRFCFLNVEHELEQPRDWNHPQWEKLWLYNLHYFDDLDSAGFAALAERWIAENPPAAGNGWEPYPTSLRIVNWIKWALAGNALSPEMQLSLAMQCRRLMRRLEWHLLGNHLFANAKALVFAGVFFEGSESARWRERGLSILRRELPEQILADGAHFELSPMYHSIILEDLLDMANLSRTYPGALPDIELGARAARMLGWLQAMTHPDGRIAFMNDAAFGIASEVHELAAYAGLLNVSAIPTTETATASGYLRIQNTAACAILDVARIGPDYIPGHAHADTLSFELSLFGRRVIVNSGTSTYQASAERLRQRSTAAHSTLEIDGESSSQVWAGFRVARRARPFELEVSRLPAQTRVRCAHDGYRRLRGKPVHHREWVLSPTQLKISDTVQGKFNKAVARFYFHPDCVLLHSSDGAGAIAIGQGAELHWSIEGGRGGVIGSTYHPEFGLSIHNLCLCVETVDSPLAVVFNWRR